MTGNITACYDDEGKVVFGQEDIEEAVIGHFQKTFKGQRTPVFDDSNSCQDDTIEVAINDIDDLLKSKSNTPEKKFEAEVCAEFTLTELNEIISMLPNQKSSGIDNIPNEFLKNSTFNFKTYLLQFYNKILEEGAVPGPLNTGKCCLIWKVILQQLAFYKLN